MGANQGGAFKIDLSKASRQKQIKELQFKFPELKGTAQIIVEEASHFTVGFEESLKMDDKIEAVVSGQP